MDEADLEKRAFGLFKDLLDLDSQTQRARLAEIEEMALAVRVSELLGATNSVLFETVDARPVLAADLEEDEIPIPLRIGPYDVVRQAGSGATAIVYEAIEAIPFRRVAVKVFRTEFSDTLLVGEVQALAERVHPFIPLVLQVGDHAGVPWIAMEWVDGDPIGPEHQDRAVELVAQICDAVHAAHERGLLHRDLKPSNILVRPDGRPMVLDFGLWRSVGAVGTPPYRAPEVEAGQPADRRSDVYALGVILRELGAPEEIVDRATARDPEHRFQDALALGDALRDLARPPKASPAETAEESAPTDLRMVIAATAGLTLVVVLLLQTLTGWVLKLPIPE